MTSTIEAYHAEKYNNFSSSLQEFDDDTTGSSLFDVKYQPPYGQSQQQPLIEAIHRMSNNNSSSDDIDKMSLASSSNHTRMKKKSRGGTSGDLSHNSDNSFQVESSTEVRLRGDGSSSSESDTDMFDDESVSNRSQENALLSKTESQKLQGFQCVVTVVLTIITALVVLATYMVVVREDLSTFESAFMQSANRIGDTVHHRAEMIADAFRIRSESITSFALTTNKVWPFVTIPHFITRGENIRSETLTEVVGFAPFVSSQQKAEWEFFSVENEFLLYQEEIARTDADDTIEQQERPPPAPSLISPVINHFVNNYTSTMPDMGPGPYLPIWQVAPTSLSSMVNLNLLSEDDSFIRPLVDTMLLTNGSVISQLMIPSQLSTMAGLDFHEQSRQRFHLPDASGQFTSSIEHPHSLFFHPVFDTFDVETRKIVASLFAILPWDLHFTNLLSDDVNGVYCVLQNNCGEQPYTYFIDGKNATYLGEGDFHETYYNYLKVTIQLFGVEGWNYTEIDLDDDILEDIKDQYCMYEIFVYPSEKLENFYKTNRRKVYTSIMGVVFLFTALIFWSYVRYLQKRNNIILATALHTSRIVSSLFPSNVRARIMEDAEKKAKKERETGTVGSNYTRFVTHSATSQKYHLRMFMNSDTGNNDDNNARRDTVGPGVFDTKPIADLFPNCTVLFADIVGFTAWSSVREPTQVFQLLESIFHCFDENAARRRVFKVETVGDCYVAVTGLPDPRRDHAVVMSRFANESLTKMLKLVKKLEMTLGPGTAELTMRFGMHSGAVTAGVLRGEKSRFQLFGDTVNTAARMESNGMKDRIHISQDTADLLIAAGKAAWVETRKDKILAKGKGEMQTFWLNVNPNQRRIVGVSGRTASGEIKKKEQSLRNSLAVTSPNSKPFLSRMSQMRRSKSHSDLSAAIADADARSFASTSSDRDDDDDDDDDRGSHRRSGESFEDTTGDDDDDDDDDYYDEELDDVQKRLVRWVVDLLTRLLKQIIAQRSLIKAYRQESIDDNGGQFPKKGSKRRSKRGRSSKNNYSNEDLVQQQQKEQEDLRHQRERLALAEQQFGSNMSLEEVQDIVSLPPFDDLGCRFLQEDLDSIELDPKIETELVEYVTTIATLYNDNEFHNFAHASHVTMAVMKLVSRITSQEEVADAAEDEHSGHDQTEHDNLISSALESIHDRTYGISSDPIAQFAIVFSALIHDVDHSGVSNEQLISENAKVARLYNYKCILEQNSFDLAWSILMDSRYQNLRYGIYTTEAELLRFRSIVLNTVMATDLMDEELRQARDKRWMKVFKNSNNNIGGNSPASDNIKGAEDILKHFSATTSMATATTTDTATTNNTFYTSDNMTDTADIMNGTMNSSDAVNQRATLVIEYLIQASDLAHTMQHWAVYRKWNEKLFREEYYAYLSGRSSDMNVSYRYLDPNTTDSAHPADYWYSREIRFFDNCVIPVAKKLKECGVFGIYSDEYLDCAIKNRAEWEFKGKQIVDEMLESVQNMGNNTVRISVQSTGSLFL